MSIKVHVHLHRRTRDAAKTYTLTWEASDGKTYKTKSTDLELLRATARDLKQNPEVDSFELIGSDGVVDMDYTA
jgi:hypothetical protein